MAPPEKWWVGIKAGSAQATVIASPRKPAGYQTVLGPFPTKAAAERFAKKPSPLPKGGSASPPVPNPLSGIGAVGHWIGKAVLDVTDLAMWRSLGWLALGAFLVFAGIYLWFRTSATYGRLEAQTIGLVAKAA